MRDDYYRGTGGLVIKTSPPPPPPPETEEDCVGIVGEKLTAPGKESRIKEIQKRLKRIQGCRVNKHNWYMLEDNNCYYVADDIDDSGGGLVCECETQGQANFIANSPEDIIWLLQKIKKLKKQIKDLKKDVVCARCTNCDDCPLLKKCRKEWGKK